MGAHILARNLIGPQKAAETIVYLATSSDVGGVTGKYFFDKKPMASSPVSYDCTAAKKLWDISMQLTAKFFNNGSQGISSFIKDGYALQNDD